jgi:hypothetical protein
MASVTDLNNSYRDRRLERDRERKKGSVRRWESMPARYRTTLHKGVNRDNVCQILTVGYIRE